MKTYNNEVLGASKRLSDLSKSKLFLFSKLEAMISTFIIVGGGALLAFKREKWVGGIVIFGIASLLTSGFNIFRSKEN